MNPFLNTQAGRLAFASSHGFEYFSSNFEDVFMSWSEPQFLFVCNNSAPGKTVPWPHQPQTRTRLRRGGSLYAFRVAPTEEVLK